VAAVSLHANPLHPSCYLRGRRHAGVRLLLPLRWVPERLGAIDWVFSEPPTGHGPWVDELGRQLEMFRDRLLQVRSAASVTHEDVRWLGQRC